MSLLDLDRVVVLADVAQAIAKAQEGTSIVWCNAYGWWTLLVPKNMPDLIGELVTAGFVLIASETGVLPNVEGFRVEYEQKERADEIISRFVTS